MVQKVTNFARFYTAFNKLPYSGDREEFKKSVVLQYTKNRTDSLREMIQKEYNSCCSALEKISEQDERRNNFRDELRRHRSVCLNLMQRIGIDTTDWKAINKYCRSPKIAGAEFRDLDIEDLDRLSLKLRMILKKQSKQ